MPKPNSSELEHYGILGMKWGVRRTPEQLGYKTTKEGERQAVSHSIKAGTRLYRVTSESGKGNVKGSTYFTMLPPDRDFYRGSYSRIISQQQGGDGRAYESVYKTNKELKIANRLDLLEEYNSIVQNEKLMKTLMIDYSKSLIEKDARLGRLDVSRLDANEAAKKGMEYLNREVSKGLTVSTPIVRESLIQNLKKKGFNGYIDEAGVGGLSSMREGVEPIVIFDAERNVVHQSSQKLTANTIRQADARYDEWFKIANSRIFKKQPW